MLALKRNIDDQLISWARRENRKPLLLRGARQVGKTFACRELARKVFNELVELNLEKQDDFELFNEVRSAKQFIADLRIAKNAKIVTGKTLLFIDEIQNSSVAMNQLRFLYEEMPELHVIAAGSLLEVELEKKNITIPVGRVEYQYIFPLTFDEFLLANNLTEAYDFLNQFSLNAPQISSRIDKSLLDHFKTYMLIGGLPEIVASYARDQNYSNLAKIYESLLSGFRDDINKYAQTGNRQYLQHVIRNAPQHVGSQITFENFAGSSFKSREMSYAFSMLEKAFLLALIRPTSSTSLPLEANLRARPKLLFLDGGLVCFAAGVAKEFVGSQELSSIFQGKIAEQVVGQTLLATSSRILSPLLFWSRVKAGASAEVDFLLQIDGNLLPIEVKSGTSGRLRSLHEFIDRSESTFAVRVYSGPLQLETLKTRNNKTFKLYSIPFYLVHRIMDLFKVLLS